MVRNMGLMPGEGPATIEGRQDGNPVFLVPDVAITDAATAMTIVR